MLRRLFCIAAPLPRETDREWVVSQTQYVETQTLYSKGKILDIVEDELEDRYKAVEGKNKVALEATSMRRLHRAHLPMEDSQRATEALCRLTAIDNARIIAEKNSATLEEQLAKAQEDKRMAEFAQARAEQLAIARGEALYRCQERLTEAEQQQVQLADVLKSALDKLGMGFSPSPGPRIASRTHNAADAVSQKIHGHAASPSGEPPLDDPGNSQAPSLLPTAFTVYSNGMHIGRESPPPACSPSPGPSHATDPASSGGSSTKWRDISQALVEVHHEDRGAIDSLVQIGASAEDSLPRGQAHHSSRVHQETTQPRKITRGKEVSRVNQLPPAAEGWTSPAVQDFSSHIQSVFGTANSEQFYHPFSMGAAGGRGNASTAHLQERVTTGPSTRARTMDPPPPPGRLNPAHKGAVRQDLDDGQLIKAVPLTAHNAVDRDVRRPPKTSHSVLQNESDLNVTDEDYARTRHAVERLSARINRQLPPQYRCEDPLGLKASSNASYAGSSTGRQRPPKGSLRQLAGAEIQAAPAPLAAGARLG